MWNIPDSDMRTSRILTLLRVCCVSDEPYVKPLPIVEGFVVTIGLALVCLYTVGKGVGGEYERCKEEVILIHAPADDRLHPSTPSLKFGGRVRPKTAKHALIDWHHHVDDL